MNGQKSSIGKVRWEPGQIFTLPYIVYIFLAEIAISSRPSSVKQKLLENNSISMKVEASFLVKT